MLGIVGVDRTVGESFTINYENPQFKKLINGTISELNLRVLDQDDNQINNNLPIEIILQIIK